MRYFGFAILFSFHVFFVQGQGKLSAEKTSEEEHLQAQLVATLPGNVKYFYPEFKEGRVFYASHKKSDILLLNHHLVFQEMLMIANTSDTTLVTNFEMVKYILIDKDLYYHDLKKGYFQIRSDPNDSVQLISQCQLKLSRLGYNGWKLKIDPEQRPFNFEYTPRNPAFPSEHITVYREVTFYLLDKKGEIRPVTKGAFFKLFPQHKKTIENYFSQMDHQRQRAILQDEGDLKELLQFCLSLR